MLMDFGIEKFDPGETREFFSGMDEQCWLLTGGSAKLFWGDINRPITNENSIPQKMHEAEISRPDLFDHCPFCLSVPAKSYVKITAGTEGAEFCLTATENPVRFDAKLFSPEECSSEMRGEGTMRETSTRVVRTVFDDSNRPESNLVIGEVIGIPGKWSSYPPHHHPQPEIYHYRFLPANGFGLTVIGETPYLLKDKDTILIREKEVHPQVTAPGYAMWYLWVIRHLEGNRYGEKTGTPIFIDEHKWVSGDEKNIWQPK